MMRVGLTGNIAAGKSTVARVWQRLGATLIDADVLAREAVAPGTPGLSQIVREWGAGVLDAGGRLERAALRRIVFADPEARTRLERIVHPAVAALRETAYQQAEARGESLVVADIPLLFEVGLADEFDAIVLVDAPEEERRRRLVQDRGLAHDEAERMIAAQMPAQRKRSEADYVIENTGTVADLERSAAAVWAELQRRARP